MREVTEMMTRDEFMEFLKNENPDYDFYLIGRAFDLAEKAMR